MWNNTLLILPSDGAVVWLRIEQFSFFPPVATFDADTNTFTLEGSGLVIDAIKVARWKMFTGSLGLGIGAMVVESTFIIA